MSKVDLSAGKIVALIGALVAICVGILYLNLASVTINPTNLALYILAGITSLAGGIIVLLIVEVLGFKIPIPYNWWILLIIGAAIIVMDLLVEFVGAGVMSWMYLGGSLIGLAGLVELLIGGGKLSWATSKFVLLVGAAMTIILAILSGVNIGGWVWPIIAIALCVILILMLFDVIPNKWWYVLGVGIAVLILFGHLTAGGVLLVGFILVLMDK